MQINSVKVIQDSINENGNRMITYEIETYRYIWAEVLTHKMLNKNAQSSRAVPVKSVLSVNESTPVEPIVWGKNQGGMSASQVLEGEELQYVKKIWKELAHTAFEGSRKLSEAGLHKMWANRPTEPFSRIKVVMSGTEWDNFEWLRDDPEAAQPEIVDLARKIKQAKAESTPLLLFPGQAHVPYVERQMSEWHADNPKDIFYYVQGEGQVSLDVALKVSASCCGQISYRKLDESFDKAMDIYQKLFNGPKPHLSPTEHQAIAMERTKATLLQRIFPNTWEQGVSHMDNDGYFWSANLKGFIQHRKIMEQAL